MGGPKNWLKSILRRKKTQSISQSRSIWRSWMGCSTEKRSTESFGGASAEPPEIMRSVTDRAFEAAVATVVRAPARDFLVIKQEWAAIRIQTGFRALLARRALRALRALVKIQAMVRGWQVRKQTAVMLQSMQALVNLQIRVRAGNLSMSSEERKIMCERSGPTDTTSKPIKETWCSSPRTMEEIRSRLQMRQVGVLKRERAIAYSKSQQKMRPHESSSPMQNKAVACSPKTSQRLDKNNPKSRWFAHWMEGDRPWGNGYTEEVHTNLSERSLSSRNISYCSEHCSGNVRRNNVMASICTQPSCQQISSSSTDFSSDFLLESSASPSSVSTPSINVGRSSVNACTCTKPHPSSPRIKSSPSDHSSRFLQESIASCSSVSSTPTNEFEHALAMERIDGSLTCIPNYMSLTKSVKAKQVANLQEHLLENF